MFSLQGASPDRRRTPKNLSRVRARVVSSLPPRRVSRLSRALPCASRSPRTAPISAHRDLFPSSRRCRADAPLLSLSDRDSFLFLFETALLSFSSFVRFRTPAIWRHSRISRAVTLASASAALICARASFSFDSSVRDCAPARRFASVGAEEIFLPLY